MPRSPSPSLPPRLRRHLGWPLLLLLACVGVAAVAVVQAQREAASHRRTAAGLLRDYAEIAAWSYGRRAEQALVEAGRQVLSPILHHELHPRALGGWPGALDLPTYRDSALAWCRCAPAFEADVYFMWTGGAAATTAHVARAAGPAPDAALARRVVDSVTAHVRDARQPRGRAGLVAVPHAGGVALAAYGLMPTDWGDTIAYAFTFDPASLDAGFQRIARDDELLPRAVTRGIPNARLLAVQVAPPAGAAAHAATLSAGDAYPDAAWPYQARVRLAPELAGLRVRAAVRPGAEAALVAGGLPRRGLPLLPALLLLATALALVAVRQLRREQELARLRADFVASVSHELRTPLAQIRLFLETLRLGRWRTAEQRDWLLGHADREATRLSHLVENVLAFARTDRDARGTPAACPERSEGCAPTDVAVEVRDAADAFAPLAAARGTAVTVRAEDDAHAALDRAAFRQVVLNLLDNAVKYGPAGQTVVVTVARRARDGGDGRDEVLVTVDDAGPGVPAAQRRRVWEPFARGEGDHVRAAGGSGIGLSIVREIVARHGGRAWLDDAPGGGLRAGVALPACAPPAPAVPAALTPAAVA